MSEVYPATGVATHDVDSPPPRSADDNLSPDGLRNALEIGAQLHGGYELLVSTGAQRATQTLACFLSALGEKVPGGVEVEEGLRSRVEERWKAAYRSAGSGELEAMRSADPELVDQDSATLAAALRRVVDRLPDGARALVVGRSPTNEAAVFGLTGAVVGRMAKGDAYSSSARMRDSRSSP